MGLTRHIPPHRLPAPWALVLIAGLLITLGMVLEYAISRRAGQPDLPPPVAITSGSTTTWTIATYNIQNFFDAYDNPYTADESTRPKPAAELSALTEALGNLDADVVLLEEVEAGGFLRTFNQTHLGRLGYRYVVDEPTDDPRGLGMAVLSRLPVLRIISHRHALLDPARPADTENHFARDLLRVDIEPSPGRTVSIYGIHLKSKLPNADGGAPTPLRLAEATRAHEIMREEMLREGQTRFILLGDCNDTVDSSPVRALVGPDDSMFDTLAHLPPAERVTFFNPKYQEGLDGIWLSRALHGLLVMPGGEILHGGAFERASDHRPVRVKLHVE